MIDNIVHFYVTTDLQNYHAQTSIDDSIIFPSFKERACHASSSFRDLVHEYSHTCDIIFIIPHTMLCDKLLVHETDHAPVVLCCRYDGIYISRSFSVNGTVSMGWNQSPPLSETACYAYELGSKMSMWTQSLKWTRAHVALTVSAGNFLSGSTDCVAGFIWMTLQILDVLREESKWMCFHLL